MTASPRRVYIAYPRLDCSFKPGPVPEIEGPPTTPGRHIWVDFLAGLAAYHEAVGDEVIVEKRAWWQFDHDFMREKAAQFDRVYMPHRQKRFFDLGEAGLYYKQSPLPGLFTVDWQGWGGGLSWAPLAPEAHEESEAFDRFAANIDRNFSLIAQPPAQADFPFAGYDLFVCQVPHDEAIVQNASVSVAEALAAVIAFCKAEGRQLLVKGHPANPKSMKPLREIALQSGADWIKSESIHTCLAGARTVFLVNSGSGFEALLHRKQVVAFGRAEYGAVVGNAEPTVPSIAAAAALPVAQRRTNDFFATFQERCIDVADKTSYHRVEQAALS